MTGAAPSLSVIIASTGHLSAPPASVLTIARQCRDQPPEIILAYSSADDFAEELAAPELPVTVLRLPRESSLPRLLGTALTRATGEVIAITDATCVVDECWVSAILKAHEAPHPIIGGAVEPGGLKRLVDWAAYFCDYGQFMLPLTERAVSEVPGNNISVKRWVVARGGQYVEKEFWKTYWCRRVQAEGLSLYAVPSIVVSYQKSFRLWPYLAHRFHNGRCFAGMRIQQLGRVGRGIYVAGSIVLPVLFCARILRAVLPKRRYLRQLLFSFPIIVLATVSWAFGEFVGYLAGPGWSCRHVR